MLNKLIKQLTCCAAFCNWFFRAIAHSIAKKYNITHTHHTHTHIYKYIHKYSRVTPQNDISFEWTRPMRDTVRALKIPRNSARFYVSSPDKRPKQLRPAKRMRHPRAVRFRPVPSLLGLSFFALDRIKSQAKCSPRACLAACLRFLCFFFLLFCFCFSIIVVLASFITPYFMLVLAFCLLLSFRL